VSAWPITTPNAQPDAVAPAPDGTFWFTLPNASRIARLDLAGVVKEFPVETSPLGLAVATDGGVWFGAPSARRLGRLDPASGRITWTSLPEAPVAIAAGPDGSVWVALGVGDKLAKIPPKS